MIFILIDDTIVLEEGVVMSKSEVISKTGTEILNLEDMVFKKMKEIERYQLYDRDKEFFAGSEVVRKCSRGYVQNFDKFLNEDLNLRKINNSGYALCPINLYNEFKNLVKELNEKVRELHFCNYALSSEEELLKMKNEEVENYNQLLQEFSEYPAKDLIEYKYVGTLTFEQQVKDELGQSYLGHSNFDVTYGMARTIHQNTIKSKIPVTIYNQIMEKLTEIRNSMMSMSADEFREYKINQLRLTLEEQNKFENNITSQKETDERHK